MKTKQQENLFYFDQDDDEEQVDQSPPPDTKLSPSKTITKQFSNVGETNALFVNFFQRDINKDEITKDIKILKIPKKKLGKNIELSIPMMKESNSFQALNIKENTLNLSKQNEEQIVRKEETVKIQEAKRQSSLVQNYQNEKKFNSDSDEPVPETICQNQKNYQLKQLKQQQSGQQHQQIHHVEEQTKNQQKVQQQIVIKITPSQIQNRRQFLSKPIQKGKVLECTLRRDKSGFNRFFPQYSLYTTDGVKFLMSSKKRTGNATSNYLISLDKNQMSKEGESYFGKLRSNWVGTQFTGYDDGYNPQKPIKGKIQRRNLCQINYQSNFFGSKGPRQMNIYVSNNPTLNFPSNKETLKQIYQKKGENVVHLGNKPPRWNAETRTFVLNFNNRVQKPSVKNFILINKSDPDVSNINYALLFGRMSDDVFSLDVKYPLSPLQAFQIVLSSFDYKLACE